MPLMIVLWLLILRGLAVELRAHFQDPIWRSFFGGVFFFASMLLAIFFGAALANVIRGVPFGADHYFFLPLWTNWRTGPNPGILDWYTVIGGVMALLALALHGSLYLILKNEGDLQRRARRVAGILWLATALPRTPRSVPRTHHRRGEPGQHILSTAQELRTGRIFIFMCVPDRHAVRCSSWPLPSAAALDEPCRRIDDNPKLHCGTA
jgi:cytochrome d ubiquinol oxidase subunit II